MPGVQYALRVSAVNRVGLGLPAASTPATLAPAQLSPSAPRNVTASPVANDATSLSIGYVAPRFDGGASVRQYRIEWSQNQEFASAGSRVVRCPNSPVREVQRVETSTLDGSTITGGAFVLSVTAPVTGTAAPAVERRTMQVAWNAIAAAAGEEGGNVFNGDPSAGGSLESILEGLDNVASVSVARQGPTATGGFIWFVTFVSPDGDIPRMSVESVWLNTTSNAGGAAGANTTATVTELGNGQLFGPCEGPQVISGLVKGQPVAVRVSAYNDIGYGPAALAGQGSLVAPAVVPGLPTDAALTVVDGGALRLTWSPPVDDGGRTVTSYVVEWSTSSVFASVSSSRVTYLSGGAPFAYTIRGLVQGTTYFVRVRAGNAIGDGAAQTPVPASAKPYTLPSAPTMLRIGVTSGRSNDSKITVGFGMPAYDGGDTVTGFRVEWDVVREMDSLTPSPDKGFADVAASDSLSYTISNLSPSRVYYVRVSARNRAGSRGNDQPLVARPVLRRPGKPSNGAVAATGACGSPPCLSVSWAPPVVPAHGIPCGGGGLVSTAPARCPLLMGRGQEADGGSAIARYVVQWSTTSDFASASAPDYGEATVASAGASTFSYTVQGLRSGATYFVRVAASNEKGLSDFADKGGEAADGSALTAVTA